MNDGSNGKTGEMSDGRGPRLAAAKDGHGGQATLIHDAETAPESFEDQVRMWMGAYLDGELDDAQEAALMQAIDENPGLAHEFEALCSAFVDAPNVPAPSPKALPASSPFQTASLSAHLSAQLQTSILAATVPEALDDSPLSAEHLTSQLVDNELSDAGQRHLDTLLQAPHAATSALAFAHATEATAQTVAAAATHPDIQEDLAFSAGAVMDTISADERAGVTWMAYGDAEASAEELERVLSTADAERLDAVALHPDAMEGVRAAFLAVAEHPAAAKAGAAALQAIAAQDALAEEREAQQTQAPPVSAEAEGSYFDRVRGIFANLAAPLVFATGAAALFVGVGGVGDTAPPQSDTKTPPIPQAVDPATYARSDDNSNPVQLAWVQGEMFATLAGELLNEETALREFDELEVLADNSETEVQTIESGAASPMVFSTEASHITVIWVPDAGAPEDDLDGAGDGRADEFDASEKMEMGT